MAKRIKIKRIIGDLDLDDYYGTGESQIIKVWINPTQEVKELLNNTRQEARDLMLQIKEADQSDKKLTRQLAEKMVSNAKQYHEFFSMLWSQDKDEETHWTIEEVAQFQKDCVDQDPGLWQFATTMSIGMCNDYASGKAKKGMRR